MKAKVLSEESRQVADGSSSNQSVLAISSRMRGKGSWKGKGKVGEKLSRLSKGPNGGKTGVECFWCHEKGHMKRYCPKWKERKGLIRADESEEEEGVGAITHDLLFIKTDDDLLDRTIGRMNE